MKVKLIIPVLLLLTKFAVAQTEKALTQTFIPQQQYWLRYYNKLKINNKFKLVTEVEDRRYFNPDRAYKLMFPRVHVHFNVGKGWEALGGFAYFSNSQPVNSPHTPATINVPELRPFIGAKFKQSTNRWEISHRYWIEYKFNHHYNSVTPELTPGYNFNFRFRYRFLIQYILFGKEPLKGTVTLIASEELFINAGRPIVYNVFDQNRIYAAIRYGLTKDLALEAGYIKIIQASSSVPGLFYNRDVFRITLNHFINLMKK